MLLLPAIDLLDGRCVRLLHGEFDDPTYYDIAPADLAARYLAEGAQWLHVVDLAASRDGEAANSTALFNLLNTASQSVQTGGGVRSADDVKKRLDSGASRVVVGSVCASDTFRFIRWMDKFGSECLVAALDVAIRSDGIPMPRIYGWTQDAPRNLWQLLDQLADAGLRHVLITDISRDGAMQGPNVSLYRSVNERYPGLEIQASGGVSQLGDLGALAATRAAAAIVGKALLENIFTVPEALDSLS